MEFNLNYHINQLVEIRHMIYGVLREKSYRSILYPTIEGAVTKEPVSFKDKDKLSLRPYHLSESWGDLFDCAWFKVNGFINQENIDELFIKLDVSGEALLFDKKGTPLKGFTNGSSVFDRQHGEPGKQYYTLKNLIEPNGYFELWFDAGANDLFGALQNQGRILSVEVVERNLTIRDLYYDLSTLFDLLESLPKTDLNYQPLFEDLKNIYYAVIYETTDWINVSKKLAKKWLDMKSNSDLTIYAVGHAHMDLAWLWPLRETRRKVGRTIANVVDMLDKYPDYIFGISQPQQIEWLRQDYPDLFKRFKEYVKIGRIELQGGMWVEADTNLSGGESLIRQIYYGQKYYQDIFGQTVKNLWLPDIFGYNGNLPQIMKGTGLDYFMTIKLSWSLINQFPHHTFIWEGIDDSKVITHMPPEGTYNSSIRPKSLRYAAEHYIEKNKIPVALNLYGIGDGGGGPGYEHIERIHRTQDITTLPKVILKPAQFFFDKLETYKPVMDIYKGELYLENHQGTLTSQANLKKAHRHMESRLKTIETLLVQSEQYRDYEVELEGIWKEHLLYEFHDILPGSSIKRVYDECLGRYEALNNQLDKLMDKAFNNISKEPMIDAFPYNPNPFIIEKTFFINGCYVTYQIKPLSNHLIKKTVHPLLGQHTGSNIKIKDYDLTFDTSSGQIRQIHHRTLHKDLLQENHANILSVYKDLGDAWNIMDHYRAQEPIAMTLVDRVCHDYGRFIEIKQSYVFKKSILLETVLIDTNKNYIEFKHQLDWQNVGYMLRTNFPLEIRSEDAWFDIQFGEIKRPRTTQNSVDTAKFEVCGHQWASIFDGKLGASLINDSKYGFHVQNGNFDMNLLRSTNYPAVNGDIGQTCYKYGLVLHDTDHIEAKIDELALAMNSYTPFFKSECSQLPIFMINHPNIDYTTIKGSYDQNGIVIRLHEKHGIPSQVTLEFKQQPKALYHTNLLEQVESEIDSMTLDFKPYQIRTIKVIF